MEELSIHEKPCLENTSRGFSVSYKNKLLYSKYDPRKAILNIINDLNLLPGTLILCNSPCLCYGLKELYEKLPTDSFVLGIELDENLFEFSKGYFQEFACGKADMLFAGPKDICSLFSFFEGEISLHEIKSPELYRFKRAIFIDFSAGTSFYKESYSRIYSSVQNYIATFWKNRITLVKFGRLYCRNLFHNMYNLPNSIEMSNFIGKIESPIFIFGAGESTEATLSSVPAELLSRCFVLTVDAALPALKKYGINPDGIVAVESQLAIEKNYIGNKNADGFIFADMASRKQITDYTKKGVVYFSSEFCNSKFLKDLSSKEFFPEFVPPLGSVGLTAVYLALKFRKNEDVPVFFTGLDFSYSLGRTHTRGAFHHTQRLIETNRFKKIENYDSAYKNTASAVAGKNGKVMFTDKNLGSYAQIFHANFASFKNLFDAGESGIYLGLPLLSNLQVADWLSKTLLNTKKIDFSFDETRIIERKNMILDFFYEEEKVLNRIKELLMFGKDVESCSMSLNDELYRLISVREYLFLHFPDGFKCNVSDISFLKRIRSEIDFFLKDVKNGIQILLEK